MPEHPFLNSLFVWSVWLVPALSLVAIIAHVVFCVALSWELLTLVGLAMLPFILSLLNVFVGKAGPLEMKGNPAGKSDPAKVPKALPSPTNPSLHSAPTSPQTSAEQIPDAGPSWESLTPGEKKLLRTLWINMDAPMRESRSAPWGFRVPPTALDWKDFVRTFSTLNERGLVKQDVQGLAYLSDSGIRYCKMNYQDDGGDAFHGFVPI